MKIISMHKKIILVILGNLWSKQELKVDCIDLYLVNFCMKFMSLHKISSLKNRL